MAAEGNAAILLLSTPFLSHLQPVLVICYHCLYASLLFFYRYKHTATSTEERMAFVREIIKLRCPQRKVALHLILEQSTFKKRDCPLTARCIILFSNYSITCFCIWYFIELHLKELHELLLSVWLPELLWQLLKAGIGAADTTSGYDQYLVWCTAAVNLTRMTDVNDIMLMMCSTAWVMWVIVIKCNCCFFSHCLILNPD